MEKYCVFPSLTNGIGNRLFRLFAAKYYSEVTGLELKIVKALCKPEHGDINDMLNLFPDIPIIDEEPTTYTIVAQDEKDLYTFKPFKADVSTNVKLQGYWQSYEYINQAYLIPDWNHALKGEALKILEDAGLADLDSQKNTWMIHFRHGDYKILEHHQVPLVKYYTKCLYDIPAGSRLHVFSDEPELCRDFVESVIEGRGITMTVSTQTRDICALYEMSHCLGGLIVANSTFSWWGAYFAKRRARNVGHTLKAYYPSVWGYDYPGQVFPPPTGLIPDWGIKVSIE